jgi:hypothetical protein
MSINVSLHQTLISLGSVGCADISFSRKVKDLQGYELLFLKKEHLSIRKSSVKPRSFVKFVKTMPIMI